MIVFLVDDIKNKNGIEKDIILCLYVNYFFIKIKMFLLYLYS